jgi:hypothetical protein
MGRSSFPSTGREAATEGMKLRPSHLRSSNGWHPSSGPRSQYAECTPRQGGIVGPNDNGEFVHSRCLGILRDELILRSNRPKPNEQATGIVNRKVESDHADTGHSGGPGVLNRTKRPRNLPTWCMGIQRVERTGEQASRRCLLGKN